jgi:hypothetical protein
MTRRKGKLATYEEHQRSMRGSKRTRLGELLLDWKPVWIEHVHDSDTEAVIRAAPQGLPEGEFRCENVAVFKLADLQRELSVDNFAIFEALYDELKKQALVAEYAVAIAKVELSTARKRSAGAKEGDGAKQRKIDAAARCKSLMTAAANIQKANPNLSKSDIARRLSERDGLGGAEAIRKKLTKLKLK